MKVFENQWYVVLERIEDTNWYLCYEKKTCKLSFRELDFSVKDEDGDPQQGSWSTHFDLQRGTSIHWLSREWLDILEFVNDGGARNAILRATLREAKLRGGFGPLCVWKKMKAVSEYAAQYGMSANDFL